MAKGITGRQAFLLSYAAKPGGTFLRAYGRNAAHWSIIRPYVYQRDASDRLPSTREAQKLLDMGLVRLEDRPELGTSTSGDESWTHCAVVLTEEGRKAYETWQVSNGVAAGSRSS